MVYCRSGHLGTADFHHCYPSYIHGVPTDMGCVPCACLCSGRVMRMLLKQHHAISKPRSWKNTRLPLVCWTPSCCAGSTGVAMLVGFLELSGWLSQQSSCGKWIPKAPPPLPPFFAWTHNFLRHSSAISILSVEFPVISGSLSTLLISAIMKYMNGCTVLLLNLEHFSGEQWRTFEN